MENKKSLPSEVYYLLLNGAKQYFKNKEDAEEMAKKLSADGLKPGSVYTENDPEEIQDLYDVGYLKDEEPTAYDLLDLSEKVANEKDPMKRQALAREYLQKSGGKQNALGEWEFEDENGTYKPTESGRAVYSKLKDEIDTNDNGKIEVDEMADFQKSLDDYASKNKKGREDIPARYRK